MRNWLNLTSGCALLLAMTLPASVSAQGWLSDRSGNEGPGFRLGDFELHPGVGVELGYDSNLYYTSDDHPIAGGIQDSAILRATAHLMFSTRGAQRREEGESGGTEGATNRDQPSVTFRGGLSGSFYHFFNASDRTNMEADASFNLAILPGRMFSLNIVEQFGRSVRPFTENTSSASFARLHNNAGINFNLATRGEVLKVTAGYGLGVDFFEDSAFQYGNNLRHRISLSETFRFLPQTAIVHDTRLSVNTYLNGGVGAPTALNDGVLLRTRVGVNGAVSSNFSVLLMAGYGAGFFSSADGSTDSEFESLVAQASARWRIQEGTSLTFGYDRDFQPSFLGNFYRRDRGFANLQMIFAGQFLLRLEASGGYYEFGRVVDPTGGLVGSSESRGDIRLAGSVFGEYRFTEWLGVNGTFRYTGSISDFSYQVDDGMAGTFLDPASFNKIELWLGVRVFY